MKLKYSYRNWITIIGALIAIINLLLIIVLFIMSTVLGKNATYLGLFIYIILPGFLLLGLIMMPVGIMISRKRAAGIARDEKKRFPSVDLNNPKHRKAFIGFTIATVIILFLSTYGSFEAYHLTESVEFCGTLCHKVMEPEYTAYQNSSHANVACVEDCTRFMPWQQKHIRHPLKRPSMTCVRQEKHAKDATGLRNSIPENFSQKNTTWQIRLTLSGILFFR
jgi:hypothetical protein